MSALVDRCEVCKEKDAALDLAQKYAGRKLRLAVCNGCEVPEGWRHALEARNSGKEPRPYRYSDWQLGGTAETLALNLWNSEMMARRNNGETDARNALDVIMECIVPEVENFVRQQCAKVARDWKAPMPPEFDGAAITAAADRFDAVVRPMQEGAAKKVAGAILAMEDEGR